MASSKTINAVIRLLEALPEEDQERVLEHLRIYIKDMNEEGERHESFIRAQRQLIDVARQARKEISQPKSPTNGPKK